MLHQVIYAAIAACATGSLIYLLFALRCVARFGRVRRNSNSRQPPVTVLKPVCGLEQGLYENLRSFCAQDYPEFEVIFATADADDPALKVIRRLIGEYPPGKLQLCVNPVLHGANRKVSNLANAYAMARHDILVVADSDMRVGPDYLSRVAGEFADPGVGAATCLYTGASAGGVASDLGALFINEWFLPSALVANALKPIRYCFGATMGVRRELLERIGGFEALSSTLADDHVLGKLVSELGYKVALVPYLVENLVQESDLRGLVTHELRWAKTVRAVQPLGYTFSFISYAVPVTLASILAGPLQPLSWALFAGAVILRVSMHRSVRINLHAPKVDASLWRLLQRDLLSFGIWFAAFFGRTVNWKQHKLSLDGNGNLAFRESQAP